MTHSFLKVLSFTFGIIVTVQAEIDNNTLCEEYSNAVINSINPAWADVLSTDLKNENLSILIELFWYIKNIKEDITSLFKLFDKIDNIFENMMKISLERTKETYDIHRRKRTASKYNQRECTISKDELIKINNDMENIFQLKRSHYIVESKCNFNLETANCSELINLMKCGVQFLKNQFIEMTSNEITSNEVNKWKVKYEKLNKLYLRLEDDLYRSNNQKYEMIINDLNHELQHLKHIINKLELDLIITKEIIIKLTIQFCSLEIHRKNVHQCLEKLNNFTNINYTDVIYKIIHRSFLYITNDNDMIIISYIIDFINSFDSKLKYNGYEFLYEIMNTRNFLSTPYVLTFGSKVQNYPKHDLNIYVKNKIQEWSYKIIDAYYWEIKAYAEKQDYSFCYYLKDIITNTYANNINNAKKIINFLDNLPTLKQKALGYIILYNEIKLKHGINGEDIIMLIYKIKEISDHDKIFNELEENVKVNLQALISQLPSWIKALLWENSVSIRSSFNNYKLISLHKYFLYLFYIETILAICPSSVDGADKWIFTAEQNGAHFKINNIDSNHDNVYYWKVGAYNNGANSYFVDTKSGTKLYTKDTIGGWSGFWYAIPKDCYQVYEEYNDGDFQQWLIY